MLVADLVDLARGDESGPGVEDVRLDTLVEEAVERARRHASDKVFFTELEPCLVAGVPGRLDRAVTNLLDNAAKWSPDGGQIEVRVRDGEVSVRDHGPGIADSDLPYVFDRFYRAPAARGLPGSGLGLAIVRQVAESHGGAVVAERANGGGAQHEPEAARRRTSFPAGMRLAIISDTHMGPGRRNRLPGRCEELIAGSDLLVHAGDVMTLEALAEIEAIGPPVRAVAGNMDGWDLRARLPDTDEIDVDGRDSWPSCTMPARPPDGWSGCGAAFPARTRSCSATRTSRCTSARVTFRSSIPAARPSGGGRRRIRWAWRAVEAVEHEWQIGLLDSRSMVAHRHLAAAHGHLDLAARRTPLQPRCRAGC